MGWVTIKEGWVRKFGKTTDETDKTLLFGILDSVSGSDILETVWEESSTENKSLGIRSVFVLLDQQWHNALKSISSIDNIGYKTLVPVNGSASDFNYK